MTPSNDLPNQCAWNEDVVTLLTNYCKQWQPDKWICMNTNHLFNFLIDDCSSESAHPFVYYLDGSIA